MRAAVGRSSGSWVRQAAGPANSVAASRATAQCVDDVVPSYRCGAAPEWPIGGFTGFPTIQKVAGIEVPDLEVDHDEGAKLLVLGWGGTYGPITAAVRRVRKDGGKVAQAHLRHLNPFPRNLGDVLRSYDRVLVPEMNLGQLLKLIRAEFLVDAAGYNQVRGLPFSSSELAAAMEAML